MHIQESTEKNSNLALLAERARPEEGQALVIVAAQQWVGRELKLVSGTRIAPVMLLATSGSTAVLVLLVVLCCP